MLKCKNVLVMATLKTEGMVKWRGLKLQRQLYCELVSCRVDRHFAPTSN